MSHLILLRHGQSMWNQANLFTGWVDVPLTNQGIEEAIKAGQQLAKIDIDTIFTSTLVRAQQTAMLTMAQSKTNKGPIVIHEGEQGSNSLIFSDTAKENMIPVYYDMRLNERNYGELQGLNKDDTRAKYGEEQVKIWRRSFDVAPPHGESLKMTSERTMPCFDTRILPMLKDDKNVLVAAHGNSLRSIVMNIEELSPEEVLQLELPTGVPRVYSYSNDRYELIEI